MSTRQYRHYVGFDDDESWKKVAQALLDQAISLPEDGRMIMTDSRKGQKQKNRFVVDLPEETIKQLKTVDAGASTHLKFETYRMTLPGGSLELWPPEVSPAKALKRITQQSDKLKNKLEKQTRAAR